VKRINAFSLAFQQPAKAITVYEFSLTTVLIALVAPIAPFAFLLYVWTIRSGFDLTDESIFLYQTRRPEEVNCYPTFDHFIVNKILQTQSRSIVGNRFILLVAIFILSIALLDVYTQLTQSETTNSDLNSTLIKLLIIPTAFALCFNGQRMFFYNVQAHFLLFICTYFFFLGLIVSNVLYMVACGIVIGILALAKLPCALALLLVYLTILGADSILFQMTYAFNHFVGLISGVFIFFSFISVFWWNDLRRMFAAFRQQLKRAKIFHWGKKSICRNFDSLSLFFSVSRPTTKELAVIGTLSFCIGYLRQSSSILSPSCIQSIALATLVFFEAKRLVRAGTFDWNKPDATFLGNMPLSSILYRQLLLIVIILLSSNLTELALTDSSSLRYLQRAELIEIFFLACISALPVLGALGTGRPLYFNFAYGSFNLILALAVASHWLAGQTLFVSLYITFFTAMFLAALRLGFYIYPYRVSGGLKAQSERINAADNCLDVDSSFSQWFCRVRDTYVKFGFGTDDYLISLYDCPGIVYLLGARSPGHQWFYTFGDQRAASFQFNQESLSLVEVGTLKNSWVYITGDMQSALALLRSCCVEVSNSHVLIGEGLSPDLRKVCSYWAPVSTGNSLTSTAVRCRERLASSSKLEHLEFECLPDQTVNSLVAWRIHDMFVSGLQESVLVLLDQFRFIDSEFLKLRISLFRALLNNDISERNRTLKILLSSFSDPLAFSIALKLHNIRDESSSDVLNHVLAYIHFNPQIVLPD